MTQWSAERISKVVRERLTAHRHEVGDDSVNVTHVQATQDGDQWRVLIQLDRSPRKMGAFDDVLNEIEEELEQEFQVQVMIVPTAAA